MLHKCDKVKPRKICDNSENRVSSVDIQLISQIEEYLLDDQKDSIYIYDRTKSQEYFFPLIVNNILGLWPGHDIDPGLVFPDRKVGYLNKESGNLRTEIGEYGVGGSVAEGINIGSIEEAKKITSFPPGFYKADRKFNIDNPKDSEVGSLFIDCNSGSYSSSFDYYKHIDPNLGCLYYKCSQFKDEEPDIVVGENMDTSSLSDDIASRKIKSKLDGYNWITKTVFDEEIESDMVKLVDKIGDVGWEDHRSAYNNIVNCLEVPSRLDIWDDLTQGHKYYLSTNEAIRTVEEGKMIAEDPKAEQIMKDCVRISQRILNRLSGDSPKISKIISIVENSEKPVNIVVRNRMQKKSAQENLAVQLGSQNFEVKNRKELRPNKDRTHIFTYPPTTNDWMWEYPPSKKNYFVIHYWNRKKLTRNIEGIDEEDIKHRERNIGDNRAKFDQYGDNKSKEQFDESNQFYSNNSYKIEFEDGTQINYSGTKPLPRSDDEYKEVLVREIESGMEVLIPDNSSRDLDFYAERIKDERKKSKYSRKKNILKNIWYKTLSDIREKYDNTYDIIDEMDMNDEQITKEAIYSWGRYSYGPKKKEHVREVLKLKGNGNMTDTVCESLEYIRKMNRQIGRNLGSVITSGDEDEHEADEITKTGFEQKTVEDIKKID